MQVDLPEGFGLAAFAGRWRLTRDITDHRNQQRGQFTGEAVFSPEINGLSYMETGFLTMAGQVPLKATRQYLWQEINGRINVRFADDRPFYDFLPGQGEVAAQHFCQPDNYRVAHDFRNWPEWHSRWQVEGPKKRYEMHSIYRRDTG
ncbi:MAG: trigger factor [Rhodobacteraceae bacterium]|nr:trigger factor [Paracoccaceae bacterium]